MKYNELCNFNEKVSEVKKRWSSKYGINIKQLKFIFNAKNLDDRLTIAESGITNMSQIFVIDTSGMRGGPENLSQNDDNNQNEIESNMATNIINLIFKTTKGKTKNIMINSENSVGTAIKKYLMSIGNPEIISLLDKGENRLLFIYHQEKLNFNDNRKIKDVFQYELCPTIIVNDVNDLIGA